MKEILEISTDKFLGRDILSVCNEVAKLALEKKQPFKFKFNDTYVMVNPGDSGEEAASRWRTDNEAAHEAWINSDEYKQREADRKKKAAEEREAVMLADPSLDEAGMRDAKVPWPKTQKQLLEYIESLLNRPHAYGTCVYAMSMAAQATFNYVAGELGVTGFQSSCADLDFIRRNRLIDGPFILLKGEDMLYPQMDVNKKLRTAQKEWEPWLKEKAKEKLADGRQAHPNVVAHWEKLAK